MFGAFAYGVDNPSGLYVLDLEHPDPLEPVGMIQSAPAARFVEILEANPSIAVLVGGAPYDPLRALRSQTDAERQRDALHLYNVGDSAAPAPLTSFSTPGEPQGVVLRGAFAYVAAGWHLSDRQTCAGCRGRRHGSSNPRRRDTNGAPTRRTTETSFSCSRLPDGEIARHRTMRSPVSSCLPVRACGTIPLSARDGGY